MPERERQRGRERRCEEDACITDLSSRQLDLGVPLCLQPNYLLPWQMNRQEACSGSAFFIESNDQKMLLTNAHVVRDYTTVRVRRHGGSHKYEAKVMGLLLFGRALWLNPPPPPRLAQLWQV